MADFGGCVVHTFNSASRQAEGFEQNQETNIMSCFCRTFETTVNASAVPTTSTTTTLANLTLQLFPSVPGTIFQERVFLLRLCSGRSWTIRQWGPRVEDPKAWAPHRALRCYSLMKLVQYVYCFDCPRTSMGARSIYICLLTSSFQIRTKDLPE